MTFAQANSAPRDVRSRRIRTIAGVFFILLCLPTLWFGLRTYGSFHLLRSAYAAGAPKTSSIRPWMTLGYVATTYGATEEQLRARLQVPPGTNSGANLKALADKAGLSPSEYVKRVQLAFADLGRANGTSAANGRSSGWFDALNDRVLTSLLNYGYPALGLTLLLGSIGLPVPDGLAMTVAGALAMGGRMNIIWAGAIALVASVIGDIVGYGIGNLLDREVLERRGRWLGLTVLRRIRVEALFERWGGAYRFRHAHVRVVPELGRQSAGRTEPLSLREVSGSHGRRTRRLDERLSRARLCGRHRFRSSVGVSDQSQRACCSAPSSCLHWVRSQPVRSFLAGALRTSMRRCGEEHERASECRQRTHLQPRRKISVFAHPDANEVGGIGQGRNRRAICLDSALPQPVAGVAADAGAHHLAQGPESGLHLAGDPTFCASMAKRLAALCIAVPASCMPCGMYLATSAAPCSRSELIPRRSSAIFPAFSGSPVGEGFVDLLKGKEVIAHIGHRVLDKLRRKFHEFARVGRGSAVVHVAHVVHLAHVVLMVVVLGSGKACRKHHGGRDRDGENYAHGEFP